MHALEQGAVGNRDLPSGDKDLQHPCPESPQEPEEENKVMRRVRKQAEGMEGGRNASSISEQTRGKSKPSPPFTADTKVSQRNNCCGLSRRGTAEIKRGGKRKEKGAREREEAAFVGRDAFITITAAAAGSRLGHSLSAGVSQTEAEEQSDPCLKCFMTLKVGEGAAWGYIKGQGGGPITLSLPTK